jgi:hypothetical protein
MSEPDVSVKELVALLGYNTEHPWKREDVLKHLRDHVRLHTTHDMRWEFQRGRQLGNEEREKVVKELARVNANYGRLAAKYGKLKAALRTMRTQLPREKP